MERKELELEQIFKYIKEKKTGVSVSDINKDLSFNRYLINERIEFLLGAEKIKLYLKVGTINLYVVNK